MKPKSRTTRRRMLKGLAALPVSISAFAQDNSKSEKLMPKLLGSWHVTAGQTSLILSIEPQNEAVVIFIDRGNFTAGRHRWRPMPGGAIVDTVPRFRLWHGPDGCELRVEMEPPPEDADVSAGVRQLPARFCMRRVTHSPIPRKLIQRSLPKGWEKAEPPAEAPEN